MCTHPGMGTHPPTWKTSSALISGRGAVCLGSLPLFGYLAVVNPAEHVGKGKKDAVFVTSMPT